VSFDRFVDSGILSSKVVLVLDQKHRPTVKRVLTVLAPSPLYMGLFPHSCDVRITLSTPTNSETGDGKREDTPLYMGLSRS